MSRSMGSGYTRTAARLGLALVLSFASAMVLANEPEGPKRDVAKLTYGKKTCDVWTVLPKGYRKGRRYPVVVAIPSLGGDRQQVERGLATYWEKEAYHRGMIVVSPGVAGINLFYDAGELVPALFEWMDRSFSYDKKRVYVTGVNQGGAGAFYAALEAPEKFAAIICIPGGYNAEPKRLEKLRGKRILLVANRREKSWHDISVDTERQLKKAGAKVELVEIDQEERPYWIEYDPKKLFDWLEKK